MLKNAFFPLFIQQSDSLDILKALEHRRVLMSRLIAFPSHSSEHLRVFECIKVGFDIEVFGLLNEQVQVTLHILVKQVALIVNWSPDVSFSLQS